MRAFFISDRHRFDQVSIHREQVLPDQDAKKGGSYSAAAGSHRNYCKSAVTRKDQRCCRDCSHTTARARLTIVTSIIVVGFFCILASSNIRRGTDESSIVNACIGQPGANWLRAARCSQQGRSSRDHSTTVNRKPDNKGTARAV